MIKLKVKQLKKRFGPKKVFADLSFEYAEGVLGISGPNGSGKSTLLKCLGNLLHPTEGTIEWTEDGQMLDTQTIQQKLGYVAPYINLYEDLSCRENLSFLAKMRHENNATSITAWLRKLQLSDVADQSFGNLSSGQQQRLRLCSALFHEPDILLLDEPGTNLDEAGRMLIEEFIQRFQGDHKLLVLASNNSQELDLCDRVFSVEEQAFL